MTASMESFPDTKHTNFLTHSLHTNMYHNNIRFLGITVVAVNNLCTS